MFVIKRYLCTMFELLGDISYLLRGIFVGVLVSIPLGPIGVMIVQRTLTRGSWAGFFSGIGAALSDLVYALVAGYGFSLIIDFIEMHRLSLQVGGGAVLMAFGIYTFLQNPIRQIRRPRKRNINYWQDVVSTFVLTISNPLAVFTFLIIFAGFDVFVEAKEQNMIYLVLIGVFLGALLWWLNLTLLVGLFRRFINIRRLWWINKISGAAIALIAFGIVLFAFF